MNKIISMDANFDAAQEWLRGESTLAEFCARFDRNITGASSGGGAYEWKIAADYCEGYQDKEFFRRCEVYMVLNRSGGFFGRLVKHQGKWAADELEVGRVKKLFADLEAEGLELALQMPVAGMIFEQLYLKEEKEAFLDYIIGYFENNLQERREETLDSLAGADSFVRCIGLQVLARDAGRNKEEILKYTQDNAKAVRQQLIEILCGQQEWETDVKRLLSSKKAAERVLAVNVLSIWQEAGADYRECFAQALKKERSVKVKVLLENVLGADGDAQKTVRE